MSRNRKPLEMQKGNLTVGQQENKKHAELLVMVGREHLSRAPTWLVDKTAKAEFKRIVKEFEKINVVGNLDLNNIAGYCNAYAFYRKVTEELTNASITVLVDLDATDSARKMNGLYLDLSKNQRDYADEMRKFASLCGLTIDSRLKVGTVQVSKISEGIKSEFGDI